MCVCIFFIFLVFFCYFMFISYFLILLILLFLLLLLFYIIATFHVITIMTILIAYLFILISILRMCSAEGVHEAFFTHVSHLTVIIVFQGAIPSFVLAPFKFSKMHDRQIYSLTFKNLTVQEY